MWRWREVGRVAGTGVAVLSLLAASACSDEGSDSDSEGVARIVWLTDEEGPAQLELVEEFNKTHEDIQVTAEVVPFTQMLTAIPARLDSDNPGIDVVTVDAPLAASYVARGYLSPLDSYFSDDELAQFEESVIGAGYVGDTLFAVPRETSSQVMFVNNDLLKQAGVTLDATSANSDPEQLSASRMTWEQTVELATQVKEQTGQWGLAFEQVDYPYQLLPLVESLGGMGLRDDGKTASGYFNSAESVEAAQWYADTYNEWKISPPGVTSLQPPSLFSAGKIGMMVGGSWNAALCQDAAFECLVVAHPYFEGGQPVTPTGSLGLGIAETSSQKDATAEFIKWLALTENQQWTDKTGYISAITKNAEAQATSEDPAVRMAAYEVQNTAVPRPTTPGYQEWEAEYVKAMGSVRTGQSVQDTLDDAAAAMDDALERYE